MMTLRRTGTWITETATRPWFGYGLLFLITLLAAALRFYKLGEWSFWIDEIYTINRAQIHFGDALRVLQNLPSTLWLPWSVILTNIFLHALGVTEWSARLASALIGVASILILYFATRKTFDSGTALILAILLALSPWHIFWSQNARFYTSLMLLYTLAAFLFFHAIENDRPIYFIPFYILFYFALSERLVAAFLLPGLLMYAVILWISKFERPRGLHARNLTFFLIPILLMIVFEITRYLFSGASTFTYFVNDFGDKQVEDPFRLLISIIYNIGFPSFFLGLFTGIYVSLKKDRLGLFVLISALLPVLLLIAMNPFMFTKDRYVFMTLPFWLILCAFAVKEIVSKTKGLGKFLALGLLVVLMADAVGKDVQYYLVNNGDRRDWRAAFQLVKEKSQPDDVVVAWWPEFSPFYLGKEIMPTQDVSPEYVLQSRNRFWFIIDSETVWGNIPLRDFLGREAELIDVMYLRLPEDDFNLKVYLYDPAAQSPVE
jgi:mannosyltransferase